MLETARRFAVAAVVFGLGFQVLDVAFQGEAFDVDEAAWTALVFGIAVTGIVEIGERARSQGARWALSFVWIAALVAVVGLVAGELHAWEPFVAGLLGAGVLSLFPNGDGQDEQDAHADT